MKRIVCGDVYCVVRMPDHIRVGNVNERRILIGNHCAGDPANCLDAEVARLRAMTDEQFIMFVKDHPRSVYQTSFADYLQTQH